MPETREIRLKRLRIRSWRRGMREMDLLLGGFADNKLAEFDEDGLTAFEELLEENDQELYAWICSVEPPREPFVALIARIRMHHNIN